MRRKNVEFSFATIQQKQLRPYRQYTTAVLTQIVATVIIYRRNQYTGANLTNVKGNNIQL